MLSVEFYEFCCSYAVNGIKTDINFDVGKFFGKFDNRNLKLMCWFLFISKNGDITPHLLFLSPKTLADLPQLCLGLQFRLVQEFHFLAILRTTYKEEDQTTYRQPRDQYRCKNTIFDLASHIIQFAGNRNLLSSISAIPCLHYLVGRYNPVLKLPNISTFA